MLQKLDGLKTMKIQEQQQKKIEIQQQRILTSKQPDISKVQNEATEWKHKAEEQHRFVKQLEEEIDINEIQEKITQQTIDDEASKILQL